MCPWVRARAEPEPSLVRVEHAGAGDVGRRKQLAARVQARFVHPHRRAAHAQQQREHRHAERGVDDDADPPAEPPEQLSAGDEHAHERDEPPAAWDRQPFREQRRVDSGVSGHHGQGGTNATSD
jgi:hypothetical protein